ncbi:MAG: PH domain-containing protein [Acetobacteraceae bacterium]|nr:PH domain-containing protein [Acetobacteraceae bacterium]
MAYYTRVLQPDERVLVVGRLHWSIYVRAVLVLVVAFAILVGSFWLQDAQQESIVQLVAALVALVGLLEALRVAIRRHTTEIVVTDKRVIFKRGVISRHTVEMNVGKIETVDVEQGLLARLFDYGTVVIRGTGSGFEPLRGVGEPLAIRNAIVVG